MSRLRSPTGCPWDREQDHQTIKQCLIEEAYEVVEAIESGDMEMLRDELGDLLLQVIFHAQMAKEGGGFDFFDVASGISEKLIRRHPHVFGKRKLGDSEAVLLQWEKIKREERKRSGIFTQSALDHIPKHLPALMRTEKLVKKAIKAELAEDRLPTILKNASGKLKTLQRLTGADKTRKVKSGKVADQLGDLIFFAAYAARLLKFEPEQLLRGANKRFEKAIREKEKNC